MATFKMVIKISDRKQDGTWNVKIRVTHNKATRYIATPFWVNQEQLTRSYKIKDALVADKVEAEIKRYREAVANLGFIADGLTVDHLIELVRNSCQSEKIDFLQFMDAHVRTLYNNGSDGTAYAYNTACESLRRYNKNKPLYFSNITAHYMLGYFKSLEGLKANTIRTYITAIKTAYKLAMKYYNDEDLGIVIVKRDVFKLIELPPEGEGKRDSLSVEQMQAIINTPYTGSWRHDFFKDMFVLSFITFGSNPKDLFGLKHSDYCNNVITYRRKKISKRKRESSEIQIRLTDVAKKILSKYSNDKEYLISFDGRTRDSRYCKYVHEVFKSAGIEKDEKLFRFYTARHTMATLARNECGIDYMTVHQMLNHTAPQSLRTTDVYIKRDFSLLWEANEKLLELFDWSFYLNQS